MAADSEDDALRIANGDRLGLQAAVFARGIGTAYRFVEELEVARSP
jgi:acyl-CoA reductase-like NAD-dependent aldehyde dehydrogenase